MTNPSYSCLRPLQQTSPVIFASPHSGRDYPQDMLDRTRLTAAQMRSSEDAYVDHLIRWLPAQGTPVLLAQTARAYLDLNRSPDELDPALIEDIGLFVRTPRIASGLGVIPRVVGQGRAIYEGKLTRAEAQARIDRIWHPYHRALAGLMAETQRHFGRAILIDMHSMPRESLRDMVDRPEIVLGDRYGKSATPEVTDAVESAFVQAGFKTARNTPFAGVYITQTYGRPSKGSHCVQVEIDRSLYLGEAEYPCPGPALESFAQRIAPALRQISRIGHAASDLAAQ